MAMIFMCATMCAACANAKTVKGSKKMVRMTYNLSGFQAVDAEDQVSVTVKTGTKFSVTATVPDNVKDYFIFTVKDNTLKISNRKMSFSSAGKGYSPSVTVTLPELRSIAASDQSALSFSGNVAAPAPSSAPAQAVAALVSLGYAPSDAAAAVARVDETLSVQEIITIALRSLSRV